MRCMLSGGEGDDMLCRCGGCVGAILYQWIDTDEYDEVGKGVRGEFSICGKVYPGW